MLTDTHAHICDETFDGDRDSVIQRAANAGIGAIVAVGETLADAEKNLTLADIHPQIKPAAGLYPTHLDLAEAETMTAFIRRHQRRLVAVGEVGLDFWKVTDEPARALQKDIFAGFIRLAMELDLPLNVHSRSAGRHAVALLIRMGARRVQLHAFDAKIGAAQPALEAGYFFSIPPSVVRSRQKQKLLKHLPLSCLLVETDSPVLGPDPAARNEPANLPAVIGAIADIKNRPAAEVAAAVTANTRRLYGF